VLIVAPVPKEGGVEQGRVVHSGRSSKAEERSASAVDGRDPGAVSCRQNDHLANQSSREHSEERFDAIEDDKIFINLLLLSSS
jgi:hypothetical protein